MGSGGVRFSTFSFSFRGFAHERDGIPCQDFSTSRIGDGVAAVALADGAGSARESHVGAKIASTTFVGYYASWAERVSFPVENFLKRVLENIDRKARSSGLSTRDLSTTLLGVTCSAQGGLLLHVGDGLALLISDEEAEVLSKGFRGQFANETIFLSRMCKPKVVKLDVSKILEEHDEFSVVLMSDGGEFVFYDRLGNKPSRSLLKVVSWVGEVKNTKIKRTLSKALETLPPDRRYDDISLGVLKVIR